MNIFKKFFSLFKKEESQPKVNGSKKSLHIGINDYPGTANDLRGCVNDANGWKNLLESQYGFETKSLLDKDATGKNVVREMQNLVASAKAGDHIVITYSGHGTNVRDLNGDEPDGRDEAICLYDGLLIDDNLRKIFNQLNKDASLTFISDSCHSGTVTRSFINTLYDENSPKPRYLPPEDDEEVLTVKPKDIKNKIFTPVETMNEVLLTGCTSTEYSYDARMGGTPHGAMSYYAIKVLKETPDITYKEFFSKLREKLPSGQYPQTPQLEGSEKNLNRKVFS